MTSTTEPVYGEPKNVCEDIPCRHIHRYSREMNRFTGHSAECRCKDCLDSVAHLAKEPEKP